MDNNSTNFEPLPHFTTCTAEDCNCSDIADIENAEDTQDTLAQHRISRIRGKMVSCYCSTLTWRTLDEYGEHLEALVLRNYVAPEIPIRNPHEERERVRRGRSQQDSTTLGRC